jgi:ActR/RegA family two-component response regulator
VVTPELTEEHVARVLAEVGGNEREAARRMGISRGKLRRFLGKA